MQKLFSPWVAIASHWPSRHEGISRFVRGAQTKSVDLYVEIGWYMVVGCKCHEKMFIWIMPDQLCTRNRFSAGIKAILRVHSGKLFLVRTSEADSPFGIKQNAKFPHALSTIATLHLAINIPEKRLYFFQCYPKSSWNFVWVFIFRRDAPEINVWPTKPFVCIKHQVSFLCFLDFRLIFFVRSVLCWPAFSLSLSP